MTTSRPTIEQEYAAARPKSKALYERARQSMPSGAAHDGRVFSPFPFYVERADGARKWDVDGHAYIDCWSGHGALMLGHNHPAVVRAITEQAKKGLHYSACSELEVRWAELIRGCVPGAERVRFTLTGTETTSLAVRVARAFTGRDDIVKFESHFHGVHDAFVAAVKDPFEIPASAGVPASTLKTTLVARCNDIAHVRELLDEHPVAAVILEPAGGRSMTVPSNPAFLKALREETTKRGVVLIFDEVVTGFRYARGGAQAHLGVTPDLTALGKIIGGGLPAGAVVGRADVMDGLAWKPDPEWQRFRMIPHPGTWNAMPMTAAAGVATLRLVRDTDAVDRARALTQRLIEGFNAVYDELDVAGFAYGRASIFKMGRGEPPPMVFGDFSTAREDARQLVAGWGDLTPVIRKAMLLEGVDLMRTGGFLSAAHSEEDVDASCQAFERALGRLRREGLL